MAGNSLNVLLLAGGPSGEHPVSLRSARAVRESLLAAGHAVTVLGVTDSGAWKAGDFDDLLERAATELVNVDEQAGRAVTLAWDGTRSRLLYLDDGSSMNVARPDLVFPVLHGPGGEDGSLQGLLDCNHLPYVGSGCAASALCMDKLLTKQLAAAAGIAQVQFFDASGLDADETAARLNQAFGYPCFVKPANLGSSVGISRVASAGDLQAALDEARRWDQRIIVEQGTDAREIELAMLGDWSQVAISPPGEIVSPGGFYDFEQKYSGSSDTTLLVPADLEYDTLAEMEDIARRFWRAAGCHGLCRADFFVEKSTQRVLFNEVNTMPGFTPISMYPRLWAEAGIQSAELVDSLLRIALERAELSSATRA